MKAEDYAGSLKYLQGSMKYAVKAVLIAYGVEYPKIHGIGRFLHEIEPYPQGFHDQIQAIAETTDDPARGRRFRYPYGYPQRGYKAIAEEAPQSRRGLRRLSNSSDNPSTRTKAETDSTPSI